MTRYASGLSVLMLALMLGGCATTDEAGTEPGSQQTDSGQEQAEGETRGLGGDDQQAPEGEELPGRTDEPGPGPDAGELLDKRVLYFAFDSSEVTEEYREIVRAHAQYMLDNTDVSVRLEGHTDERGSREYNIGLGDRRASSVARLFQVQGVAGERIETVSFGEEKPAVEGHNEKAWAKNRRVEIVYER